MVKEFKIETDNGTVYLHVYRDFEDTYALTFFNKTTSGDCTCNEKACELLYKRVTPANLSTIVDRLLDMYGDNVTEKHMEQYILYEQH